MGKVKSAILTALLIAAIVTLSLFSVISCDVPGTNGVSRYNSFLSSIRLGAGLSGEATTLLYPEGVISVSDYNLVAEDADNEDRQEYKDKYVLREGVYVEKDKLENEAEFVESIAADAKILSKRLGEKGYTSYSVNVENDCKFVIRLSVPTNFTYATYKEYDASARSQALTEISNTFGRLTLNGGISLRNSDTYESSSSLLSIKEDFASYFKGVSYYAMGGQHAVRLQLNDEGFRKLNTILLLNSGSDSSSSENQSAYIYVGENNVNLTLTMGTALEDKTLYFSSEKSNAQDFAILLGSVVDGNILVNSYNTDTAGSGTTIIAATPSMGEYAAIYVLAALLLAFIAAIVGSIVKYKKLGLVHTLMCLIYGLVIIISLMLLEITLTVGGAFMIALGLALLTFTNFRVFEAIRGETLGGRTITASIKSGYKKTLTTILDLHIVVLIASIMVALICVGELAACGFIAFIATLASYVLYWFTRLAWYIISSPVKDKFAFCGFVREVSDEED